MKETGKFRLTKIMIHVTPDPIPHGGTVAVLP